MCQHEERVYGNNNCDCDGTLPLLAEPGLHLLGGEPALRGQAARLLLHGEGVLKRGVVRTVGVLERWVVRTLGFCYLSKLLVLRFFSKVVYNNKIIKTLPTWRCVFSQA